MKYTAEMLASMNVVDTTPRIILSNEMVEFRCSCDVTGSRKLTDAKKAMKLYGFYYQCDECRKAKYKDRGETWMNKVRLAANSDEHKARASLLAKSKVASKDLSRLSDYWVFSEDLTSVKNTDTVSAACKTCNTPIIKELRYFTRSTNTPDHGCLAWRLRDKSSLLREYYEKWAAENPELVRTSLGEREISEWINSMGLETRKYRYDRSEIDVFVPKLNIGIEYNGLYWHSELRRDRNYHLDKTKKFAAQGIRIIHIFEHEWKNRNFQVKSYLHSALKQNENRLFARKMTIQEVDKEIAQQFLDQYHIQGAPNHITLALGLFFGDDLISLATFAKHHRGADQWVLNRFVTKHNYSVVGGLSRLSSHASILLKEDIYSWADYRLSQGDGYVQAGWELEEKLAPDYFYSNGTEVFSKQSRKKSLVGTPNDITELEHATMDGLFRVWDCGKLRFRFKFC